MPFNPLISFLNNNHPDLGRNKIHSDLNSNQQYLITFSKSKQNIRLFYKKNETYNVCKPFHLSKS